MQLNLLPTLTDSGPGEIEAAEPLYSAQSDVFRYLARWGRNLDVQIPAGRTIGSVAPARCGGTERAGRRRSARTSCQWGAGTSKRLPASTFDRGKDACFIYRRSIGHRAKPSAFPSNRWSQS